MTGGERVPAGPVGRVLGTDDATPLRFWVALAPDQYLQLDDVVVCERAVPGRAPVAISGVVTQVRSRHEGARFDSDVFAIEEGLLPADVVEAAEVTTTRVEPEVFVPPRPGTEVRRATDKERDQALFFDQMVQRVPIGLGRDGEPLYANLEFLDGTRGAHVNISGISGVATKTTYATFLLYGLFHSGVLGADAVNTKALVFNVKGEDLLFLDHDNVQLAEEHRRTYRALGLVPGPFRSVAVFAPPRRNDPNAAPDVATRTTGVHAFYWTIADFCEQSLLPFAFADAEDDRFQYTTIVHNVASVLAREGERGVDGTWRIAGGTLRRYEQLVDLVVASVTTDDEEVRRHWVGGPMPMGTVNAFVRRLLASQRSLARLVRADVAERSRHSVSTSDAQVSVVDLHNLDDRAKRFVVGVTIRAELERKEAAGQARPLLFLVLDELNKYAPREGASPIKEILLDVAERGRSLGIILIGAQQTASEVERRVIANAAIRVTGRLDPAEAQRGEYGFLPGAHRDRAVIAKPGTMFVSQPEIPLPLVAEFPFPAWATRPSERAPAPAGPAGTGTSDDPFAGFPE